MATHRSFSDQLFFQSLCPRSFFFFTVVVIRSKLSEATSDGQAAGQRRHGEARSDNRTFALVVRISKTGL